MSPRVNQGDNSIAINDFKAFDRSRVWKQNENGNA
jgi:hypothetical protein